MSKQIEQYHRVLNRYVPEAFVPMLSGLLAQNPVHFRIVKPRKTKLGDFRPKGKMGRPQITVNGDLNPYSFLITALHEFAHLFTYEQFGNHAAPHGKEWKDEYRKLLLPLIDHPATPEILQKALKRSIARTKASSCTDMQLQRVLLTFSSSQDHLMLLEQVDKNCIFALEGRLFRKGHLRRTRFICTEVSSGKAYLINALAQVEVKDGE